MKKVITYGTYDLLHYGHIRLLERAKALGDYLIVGVTAEDFDVRRGKINVQQSLAERIEGVKQTGLADEIIVEEYEGQKIDDIKRYGVDIFTVGSDWEGKFDYLNEYCQVIYLDRTKGISSSQIRSDSRTLKLGIVGSNKVINKYINEDKFVNGLDIIGILTDNEEIEKNALEKGILVHKEYKDLLKAVDAVFVVTNSHENYKYIHEAIINHKHVLCESPISIKEEDTKKLYELANENNVILMEAIKTAYATAFNRLILLIKSGVIGKIVSIDCTCTSLEERLTYSDSEFIKKQKSMYAWGPTALLPVFCLLGIDYKNISFSSMFLDDEKTFDLFTNINIIYDNAVANIKIGKGVKSEGSMIISGTNGYIYVPAPWWKTDYFEVKCEDEENKKRYFYKLDGEGIRFEYVTFIKSIQKQKLNSYINPDISIAISKVIEKFDNKENLFEIKK